MSSSDHSGIVDILRKVNSLIIDENINFSLPSLRIETFGQEVIDAFPNKRKGNFTIAPEAGTDALRSKINKPIPHESILATVNEICQKGWNNIKLYFMVGFPGETLDDIEGIIDLCREIRKIGKKNNPSRFKLHVNVNVLIPKPHTAFQWSNFASESDISKKFDLLIPKLKQARIRIDYPDYDAAMLEAVLSRGDRRLSEVIYHAWKNGAKFDAWQEGFKVQFWSEAFQQSKVDPTFYFSRQRDAEEVFPWDHINIGVKKGYLRNEFEKSINGDKTPACHEKCMACGIQSNYQIICSKLLAGESTIQ